MSLLDKLPDPKTVSQSEYAAIYDVLESMDEQGELDVPMMVCILEEFRDWATSLLKFRMWE